MNYSIYNTETISFIGGSYEIIDVSLYDLLGEDLEDVVINTVIWQMSKYGESESLLVKETGRGINFADNNITITLSSTDTTNLSGFFMHQITIIDGGGKSFVIDLGQILIKSKIK